MAWTSSSWSCRTCPSPRSRPRPARRARGRRRATCRRVASWVDPLSPRNRCEHELDAACAVERGTSADPWVRAGDGLLLLEHEAALVPLGVEERDESVDP